MLDFVGRCKTIPMEYEQPFLASSDRCSVVVHEDIVENDTIEPKMCPLCNSKVKLYQIHFNEKFLMCSNITCVFPFGVADYHVYKILPNEDIVPDYGSIASMATGSTVSQSDWSEIDKYIPTSESSFSPDRTSPSTFFDKTYDITKIINVKKTQENEEKIKRDVKKITELNKTLFELDNSLENISNTKWLRSLAQMQERSGIQLLKENELDKVKTVIPHIGTGELRIDIDSGRNVISVHIEPDMSNNNK